MSRVVVKRGERGEPLTWGPVIEQPGGPVVGARVTCPNRHSAQLDNHVIHTDGTVSPSAVCPFCDFHEFIILEGWGA